MPTSSKSQLCLQRGQRVVCEPGPENACNSAVTNYEFEASCKTKSHDHWFRTSLDSEVSAKVQCALISNNSQTYPLMVQLVARVKAVNSFGSTWSKSLHLHVPIRDWNHQASFEFDVLLQPSPSPPFLSPHATENLPAPSTSERPYVDVSSVHTPSESLTYHHGDSDIKTAGIYSHYPQTEPPVIQTTSGTGSRPQLIFLVESPSNKTDFAVENSPEKDDIDLWVPIGLPTGILVYIAVAIILRRYVVYRKRLSEDTKETTEEFEAGEQRDERSEPLPSTVAETTSIPGMHHRFNCGICTCTQTE